MIRIAFIMLCLSLAVALPQNALAQETLNVRAGVHEEYSRLVFDWQEAVGYKISTPSPTQLEITFEKSANVDGSAVKAENITAFAVLGNDPLRVSLTIPAGSRTRDFNIGTRVVVDIYNPPGAPANKPAAETPVAQAPEPKAEETKPEKPKAEEPKAEVKPEPVKEEAKMEPAKAEPEIKQAIETPEPAQEKLKSISAAAAAQIDPHVITITSTKNVGIAAFDSYGALWMITDLDEYFLKPQINGTQVNLFSEITEGEIEGGRAYTTTVPKGANVRGQGGGLLWRIVVSSDVDEKKPIEPERRISESQSMRGGTLVWKFAEASAIMDYKDPVSGEMLKIVTTKSSKDFSGPARDFVDFETLHSMIGMVVRAKVDDLDIKLTADGVEITRPGGLALMSEDKLEQARRRTIEPPTETAQQEQIKIAPRIFSFPEWQMGGISAIEQNENIILNNMHEKPEGAKYEDLMMLARMHLSNGRGAEALGFLSYAKDDLEGLDTNPDFLALRGVAQALDLKSEDAFEDLSIDELKPFPEIDYWRAFVLADLGDWQQAQEILPEDLNALYDYPPELRIPLSLVLSEVALRGGNIDLGEEILALAERDEAKMVPEYKAALQYLKGEANRQAGYEDEAKKAWYPLTKGKDDLYRAKAGLALTRLMFEEGEIDTKKAIDNLERLRYAWRGDDLEASINYWLGRTYFDAGDYVKGLTIMREATTYAPGTNLGKRITEEMAQAFTDLYLGPHLEKVSPLDAVAIYEQFSELTPPGETGDKVVQALAEHLVKADLLGRAGDMLKHQVDHRLQGDEAARVSVRLAAIRLLDRQPEKAIASLDHATTVLRALPAEVATPGRFNEIALLRAKALSQQKKSEQALALLKGMELTPDVNRLRADIAWGAGFWDDASEALNDVVLDQNISLTRPLSPENATLILNLAIAYNLASDRVALANVREKYTDAMAQTDKSRLFEVVTRPRQNAALADRDTLLGIVSETDLFSDFLNTYRAAQTPSN